MSGRTSANSSVDASPNIGNGTTAQGSTIPVLIGWGGVRLDEAAIGGGVNHPTSSTPSVVFPGESATNMELVLIQMKAMGYNTVRVDFDPMCTPSQYMSPYSATNLERAIHIAQHFGFWIVIDYHGYSEPFNTAQANCWLNFWSGVTNQFKNSYSQIIWEPINEPCYASSCAGNSTTNDMCSSASTCVPTLSRQYQLWIDQARGQGDTHWIVVQNICSYGCSIDWASGFPKVTDPLGTLAQGGRIFISLHSYMGYSSGSWNISTADSMAEEYYQAVVSGISTTGWPALNTEGGTDPLCTSCAPDTILTGSAGYTNTTLHFIQTLTNLYDTNSPQRINWIWWPAGSWTDTPGSGIYGALQCNGNPVGWGCLLNKAPIRSEPVTTSNAIYTLNWTGFDWDGTHEETLTLNGKLLATLPSSAQNGQTNVAFSLNITSLTKLGVNTLVMTHAGWDCAVSDNVSNLQVVQQIDNQTTIVYDNPSTEPLSCTQTLIYQFTIFPPVPPPTLVPPTFTLSWRGFDWDGANEETLTLNGHFLASLPTTSSAQNGQTFVPFSLDITSLVVSGVNTLVITHAGWDCSVTDAVENLQIIQQSDGQTIIVYDNATPLPLSCTQTLTYIFTVSP